VKEKVIRPTNAQQSFQVLPPTNFILLWICCVIVAMLSLLIFRGLITKIKKNNITTGVYQPARGLSQNSVLFFSPEKDRLRFQ